MERIEFAGRSGLTLVGDLEHADSACAVVMVHDFLGDRRCGNLFISAAHALRRRGWSSLRFDLSGCGESEDNRLNVENAKADVQAALALMRSMCYRRIALWGHGLGSRFCLELSSGMDALVLSDALLGRVKVDWRTRFSAAELQSLARLGGFSHTARRGSRRRFQIDGSLLEYFSTFETGKVLTGVRCPVLVLQASQAPDQLDVSLRGLMKLLPENSRHHVVPRTLHSTVERPDETARSGAEWIEGLRGPQVRRWH
jgi:pimeloyl-ACP methyl ester carboxylesterase